jgi:hypothetical protein
MGSFFTGQMLPQQLWACNRDTSNDWVGPNAQINVLINTHPDKDALIAYFRDGDLEGNEDDF